MDEVGGYLNDTEPLHRGETDTLLELENKDEDECGIFEDKIVQNKPSSLTDDIESGENETNADHIRSAELDNKLNSTVIDKEINSNVNNEIVKAKSTTVKCKYNRLIEDNVEHELANENDNKSVTGETDKTGKLCEQRDIPTQDLLGGNWTSRERHDSVDGNWISRETSKEPNDRDFMDTSEAVDTENKRRTVVEKIKYWLGLLIASAEPIIALAILVYDIAGDIELAINYKVIGEMTYFWITVTCIVVPAVLLSVVDICWIIMGRRSNKLEWHEICRIIIGSLSLGRLVRTFICAIHTVKGILNPRDKCHHHKADEAARDEALLDFISAFTEDIIMLSVQLYIYITGPVEFANPVHSLVGSMLGVAWTYSILYRHGRKARCHSKNLRIFGFLFFFMAAFAALAAREISIVFFVIYVEIWTSVLVLTAHCIVMYIWLCRQHRKEGQEENSACAKRLYLSFFAYASLFNFVNVKEGKAAKRMIVFYVILYLESIAMAGVALSKIQQSNNSNNMVYYLLTLPVGFVIHITCIAVYYSCFHPNHKPCCKCDIEI